MIQIDLIQNLMYRQPYNFDHIKRPFITATTAVIICLSFMSFRASPYQLHKTGYQSGQNKCTVCGIHISAIFKENNLTLY